MLASRVWENNSTKELSDMNVLLIDNGTTLLTKLKELIPGNEVVQCWNNFTPEAVEKADLIILSGSSQMPLVGNEEKFSAELSLIAQTRKPIIGICFGSELITIAFGGTLKQLPAAHKGVRSVELLDPDVGIGKKEIQVYENHRWSIDTLPEHFTVIARSADGPEIIRHTSLPIWGMQIHPENHTNVTEGDEIFFHILKEIGATD